MAKRRRCATSLLVLILAIGGAGSAGARKPAPLRDAPVAWWEDPGAPIPQPETRDPHALVDMARDGFFLPLERFANPLRRLRDLKGDPVAPAADVNALDEALNSSWFTNRIGLFPLSPAEVALGPGPGTGPDPDGPWLVVAAKAEGVTPGFTVRDVHGDHFLVKFDPPGYPGMTSAAGAVCARLFHAAGYNVPDDNVVTFTPDQLQLAEDVRLKLPDGTRRLMTRADLDSILAPVERLEDGRLLAIASRWVEGRPIGCFDYRGRRHDDPNDRIPHEQRRVLRGLRFFAAWLNHFDTKQQNSLDTWVPLASDPASGFVRHYLIDFASTLGLGASGPEPIFGRELTVDLPRIVARTAALGLHEDSWRRLEVPAAAPGLGYWTAQDFDPWAFRPLRPNSAFADCTPRDAYWAAKIISAFTEEQLRAAVDAAGYSSPEAADIVTRVLMERRDIVARVAFDAVPPLDFFSLVEGVVLWRDLGVERGIYPAATTRYRARLATVRADRRVVDQGEWQTLAGPSVALSALPGFAAGKAGPASSAAAFVAVECQVDRGQGWSRSVVCYLARASGRIVALERP
jgi:hypothetical protein